MGYFFGFILATFLYNESVKYYCRIWYPDTSKNIEEKYELFMNSN